MKIDLKKLYPYKVVPLDKKEEKKAKEKGISNTFCSKKEVAIEVVNRLNKYSGISWFVRPTTNDDKFNW